MDIIKELQNELKSEFEITKKFIALYPDDKNSWKPHEKSMHFMQLAIHLVEIFGWPKIIMETDYLDFAKTPYKQPNFTTRTELQEKLEADFASGYQTLLDLKLDELDGSWDIRQGDAVFMKWSKYGAIRHSLDQITHHRAQLGVYYRLNNITLPASYGPSADSH